MKLSEIAPDLPEEAGIEESREQALPAYDRYLAAKLEAPEYRRIRIGLDRLARGLAHIKESWRHISRRQSLAELNQVMLRLHEIETEAEKVEDDFVRGHVFDRLEGLTALRRSISEEIRWDEQSGLGT